MNRWAEDCESAASEESHDPLPIFQTWASFQTYQRTSPLTEKKDLVHIEKDPAVPWQGVKKRKWSHSVMSDFLQPRGL